MLYNNLQQINLTWEKEQTWEMKQRKSKLLNYTQLVFTAKYIIQKS